MGGVNSIFKMSEENKDNQVPESAPDQTEPEHVDVPVHVDQPAQEDQLADIHQGP